MIDAHPALKAASPQAPISDWFIGDDFHHNGALYLPHAYRFFDGFGHPRPEPTIQALAAPPAPGAPAMDFVFTVCDNAAGEVCPFWPGQPMTAHWGIEDPAAIEGGDIDKQRAFNEAFRYLRNRITAFTSLPLRSIGKLALSARLKEIGQQEGSTANRKETR